MLGPFDRRQSKVDVNFWELYKIGLWEQHYRERHWIGSEAVKWCYESSSSDILHRTKRSNRDIIEEQRKMCYCSVQCCNDMEKRAEKDRWRIRFGQYTCTRRPPNQNWWRLMCSSPKGGWEIMNTVECKFKCIHETELYPTKTSVIIFSVHSSCRKDAQICQMQGFSGHACPRFLNCISQLYFSTVFLNCISQLYFSTVFLNCIS